jgi:hypothetical protein
MNKTLVAAVGEHFVAYKLSCLGYIAAPVRLDSPATDLLASTLDGRGVVIQIKTTGWAERTRGRGANKTPHHLGFPLGRQPSRRHLNASSSPSLICMAVSQIHPRKFTSCPPRQSSKNTKARTSGSTPSSVAIDQSSTWHRQERMETNHQGPS